MAVKISRDLQKFAYANLRDFFGAHENEVVEIEILPPAIQPSDGLSMQDGLSIGIPKKVLAAAYMEARRLFFADLISGKDAAATLEATKVILLFDPEHLTAANYRKRRLAAFQTDAKPVAGSTLHEAFRNEVCFLDSILTSPLHRQSKSPTLWYHRFGVIDCLRRIELHSADDETETAFWRTELNAICKAGEQHPRNYYAWQYARRLTCLISNRTVNDDIGPTVKDWCCKHPSDISGWSYLLHLCSAFKSIA